MTTWDWKSCQSTSWPMSQQTDKSQHAKCVLSWRHAGSCSRMTPINVSPSSVSMLAERRMKKGKASWCYTQGVCLSRGWASLQMPSIIYWREWWPNLQHLHEPLILWSFFQARVFKRFQDRMRVWVWGPCPCWFFRCLFPKTSTWNCPEVWLHVWMALQTFATAKPNMCSWGSKHSCLQSCDIFCGSAVGLGWMCLFIHFLH